MISANLSRQAPPGMELRRAPAKAEANLPTDHFTASEEGGQDDDKSRLIIAGVGLAVAGAAAAGAMWVTNNVSVPDTPPISIEAPQVTPRERIDPQPIVPHYQAPRQEYRPEYRPDYRSQRPAFTPNNQTTTIDTNGLVTVPLGNSGVSIDSQGRTAVDLGPATIRSDGTTDVRIGDRFSIRSDGTTGVRLNENMSIRSDGTVEWHLGR